MVYRSSSQSKHFNHITRDSVNVSRRNYQCTIYLNLEEDSTIVYFTFTKIAICEHRIEGIIKIGLKIREL